MANQDDSKALPEDSVDALAERILDTAVRLAEGRSWESIRLHQVAIEMGIDLGVIHRFYAQKDDLVEAWYDRADRAMLADAARPDYLSLTTRERLHRSIMCWLMSMQNHRRVSRDMLMYKLELGHVHLQVLGLLRVSRTVQWFLESAHRDTVHLQRVTEEIGLTSIYLATFSHWLFDNSTESVETKRLLERLLRRAESMAQLIAPFGAKGGRQSSRTYEAGKGDVAQGVGGSAP
ncbi:MAG: TetR/AcrR family transcriptional regulator [Candidatus Thiodiazotropha sp. (ex Monitilora ramsayi)]|nr:TetR/AcrR family transcriptional regulator [Candidatus Thiodiazotropha sp. (ex Monitilora ramsayi)]